MTRQYTEREKNFGEIPRFKSVWKNSIMIRRFNYINSNFYAF